MSYARINEENKTLKITGAERKLPSENRSLAHGITGVTKDIPNAESSDGHATILWLAALQDDCLIDRLDE